MSTGTLNQVFLSTIINTLTRIISPERNVVDRWLVSNVREKMKITTKAYLFYTVHPLSVEIAISFQSSTYILRLASTSSYSQMKILKMYGKSEGSMRLPISKVCRCWYI